MPHLMFEITVSPIIDQTPKTKFKIMVNKGKSKMLKRLLTLSLVSSISAVATATIAAPVMPTADPNGDYYFVREARRWRVVDRDPNGLNCRSGPGANYPVVEVKVTGETLFLASEHFGGSPPYINLDERDLPWLKVDGGYESYCFVRANSRFIRPIPEN